MHICACALSEWHGMTGNGQDLLLLLSISLGESDSRLVWWMLSHQFCDTWLGFVVYLGLRIHQFYK